MSYPVRVYGPILNQSLHSTGQSYKCALHLANTKLHRPLSFVRARWGRIRGPHENASK